MKPLDYFKDYEFTVTFRMSTCTKKWKFPSSGSIFDRVYTIDKDKKMVIDFANVNLSNCPFLLSLWNTTTSIPTQVVATHLTMV